MMFEIKFRITQDVKELKSWSAEQFDLEGDLEGFFALNFNGNWYGYYHENELKEGEEGFDLITRWFEDLLKGYLKLEESDYVIISDIESYNTWLEFIRSDKGLKVSVMQNENKSGYDSVVTTIFENRTYSGLKDITIAIAEFKTELIGKAKSYIKKVGEINPKFLTSKRISNLAVLIKKVEV